MKKIFIPTIMFYLLIFHSNLLANEKVENYKYLEGLIFGYSSVNKFTSMPIQEEGRIVGGLKSYKKAILLSGLVPGAGEIYNGSFIKGFVFIGIEALGWSSYFKNNKNGRNIEDEFHMFADTHWSEVKYLNILENYELEHGREPTNLTHELPEEKTQQYYEMIGKYDQFACGWEDCDEWDGYSERRFYYEDKRYQSNKYLKKAITATSIIFINRIISLIDTIWGVKLYNDRVKNENIINLIPVEHNDEIIPSISFRLKW